MSSSARKESDEKVKVFVLPLPHGPCLLYVVFLSICICVRNCVYLSKYLRWPCHVSIVFCKLSFVFFSFCICVRNRVHLSKYLRLPCHEGIVFCKLSFVFCLFVFVFGIVCIFVSLCGGLVMWILAWVKKKPRSFSSKVLKVAEWRQLFQLSHYIITIYRSSKNISREKTWISLISIHSSTTSIRQLTLVK